MLGTENHMHDLTYQGLRHPDLSSQSPITQVPEHRRGLFLRPGWGWSVLGHHDPGVKTPGYSPGPLRGPRIPHPALNYCQAPQVGLSPDLIEMIHKRGRSLQDSSAQATLLARPTSAEGASGQ